MLSCWKAYSFQAIIDIDSKFWYDKSQFSIKVVSKFDASIFYIFWEIGHQRALRFDQVGLAGPGRFIVWNYSDIHKMVIKMYFDFLKKVLELFECERGDITIPGCPTAHTKYNLSRFIAKNILQITWNITALLFYNDVPKITLFIRYLYVVLSCAP